MAIHAALNHLTEIALREIKRNRELHGEEMPAWVVDRTLRNILIAYEAESRRLSRFFRMGHTPGKLQILPATMNVPGSKEFPFTLALRKVPRG
jgi:uncharacterized protein (DUF2126 family)